MYPLISKEEPIRPIYNTPSFPHVPSKLPVTAAVPFTETAWPLASNVEADFIKVFLYTVGLEVITLVPS